MGVGQGVGGVWAPVRPSLDYVGVCFHTCGACLVVVKWVVPWTFFVC